MSWCDTSAIDWDAVGAIGTWSVGLAAAYLAFQANRLAKVLRESQSEKEQRHARAIVLGLRLEVLHYALRLKRLGEILQERAIPAQNKAIHAAAAFEAMERVRFSDFSHRVAVLPNLPAKMAEKITFLYAQEQTSRATFEASAGIMRKLQNVEYAQEALTPVIIKAAEETGKLADSAFDLLTDLTNFLGLPLDPDYRNGNSNPH